MHPNGPLLIDKRVNHRKHLSLPLASWQTAAVCCPEGRRLQKPVRIQLKHICPTRKMK